MDHAWIRKLEKNPSQNVVIITIVIAAVATIVVWLLMRPVEEALKVASPYGVMELEFAWTVAKIDQIFQAWGPELIAQELYVTLVDYVFLIVYSSFFAGVTLLLTRRLLSGRIQLVGFYMTLVSFVAALFDAIENLNLILMLTSPTSFPAFSPFLTSIFATLKFGLLIVIIIFWIGIAIWHLFQRASS